MKKLVSLLICFILCFSTVYAYPDGLYSQKTDIKVILHGKEIPSCAVGNSMYIAAEDMAHYGYTVTYVDDVRTLFVNQTGEPNDVTPKPCKVKKALKTDIRVILNGEFIGENDSFAADGKMYIKTAAMTSCKTDYDMSGDENVPIRYYPTHFLSATWNGEERIYYMENAELPSKDELVADFLSYNGNREEYTFLSFAENRFEGDGFEIIELRVGGLPRGSSQSYKYFTNDGKRYNLRTILSAFRLRDGWGDLELENPRLDGRKFYFESPRSMGNAAISGDYYYGEYYLDLDTMIVHTIAEEKLN